MHKRLCCSTCVQWHMQERGIYLWSTANWKRRVLLPPDPKYAGKKLLAGLLAVSGVSAGRLCKLESAWAMQNFQKTCDGTSVRVVQRMSAAPADAGSLRWMAGIVCN